MLARLRQSKHMPRLASVAFAVLLLAMIALAVISANAFRRMNAQRRTVADDAIREYASLGAQMFGDHAFFKFENVRLRTLASVYGIRVDGRAPAPVFPAFVARATREMDDLGFAVGDTNRGFFRLDMRSGEYVGSGAAASPDIGARILHLIRTRPQASDSTLDPMQWMMLDLPEPLTVGFTTLYDSDKHEVVHFGFTYTRRKGWKSIGDAVLHDLPLLPTSVTNWGYRFGLDPSRTDTLVAIRLYDTQGRVLYDSRSPYSGSIEGSFTFNTGSGAFRAVETLHPGLLRAIRESLQANRTAPFVAFEWGGTQHAVRFPLDAMLPIVALLLAIVAAVSLWREQRLTRARRDFVASVSHELRTPLAQIRMFTETLQLRREQDEDERMRWLAIISREARRLGDLVENILLFSHIDADRATLEKERTDLGELIEEVTEGYVPLAAQRRMGIVADAPSRIFSMVDPRAMRQIVVNLLDNALKYGPAGQTVYIELERIGQIARLVIRDNGPGVPPADRRRMWEPFVRLGSKGTTGGSGIGLAVVRRLIELHDGTIAIDDAPGGGARFTIELAISDSAEGLPTRATGEFRTHLPPSFITGESPAARRP